MANSNILYWGSPAAEWHGAFGVDGVATLGSTDLGTQYNGIAMSWIPTQSDTITAIGYHQGTTTGTPTTNNLGAALYPLTTGGLPNTGATFANSALGSVTPTFYQPVNTNDNTWVWVTLSNSFTVTAGQEYAVVIWNNSGTDASNKITVNGNLTVWGAQGLPAFLSCAGGTWSKPATNNMPVMGLQSSTNAYGRPFTLTTPFTNNSFGSTTESGMSFTIPTNYGASVKLRGVRGIFTSPATNATNTWQANLYSSPGSSPVQQAKSNLIVVDRSERFGMTQSTFIFTSEPVLTTGVEYAIGFSTTAASAGGVFTLAVATASDFNAWAGQQQFAFTTRTVNAFANIDAGTATGNFADTTTKRPWLDLIIDDITASASGGMLVHPGMAGGIRG